MLEGHREAMAAGQPGALQGSSEEGQANRNTRRPWWAPCSARQAAFLLEVAAQFPSVN